MLTSGGAHLSYCTNVHPGESWPETFGALKTALPTVKQQVSPKAAFGVGLRLSATAASQLSEAAALAEFQQFLHQHDLYVFTINGFPYGPFHGTPVKEQVYEPDWTSTERVDYTRQLARLLAVLMPDTLSYASISTVPGGFRPKTNTDTARRQIADHLQQTAQALEQLETETGKRIVLALEPEPMCLLETIDETIDYFQQYLKINDNCSRYLGLCLDTCHAAVEFENAAQILARLQAADINIAKIQLSSALSIGHVTQDSVNELGAFVEDTYLHQVVESVTGGLRRYLDLPEAIQAWSASKSDEAQWRIHFHVPVFLSELQHFATTQGFLQEILAAQQSNPVSQHLEVETYTWDVLPEALRTSTLPEAIARELHWVLDQLTQD